MKTKGYLSINNFFVMLLMFFLILPATAMSQGVSVEITPSSGVAEAALKIAGKGFVPNEKVDILFILEEGMKIGLGTEKVDAVIADSSGTFTANSAIPRMAKPGRYKIEIVGSKGSQAVITLEVTPKK